LGIGSQTPRGRKALTDTGARCGEEIAQAFCLITLGFDETNLALEMVGVFQSGGEGLIVASTVFEGQGFCMEGAIEARADFVGFAVEVQDGGFFSAFGGLRVKVFYSLPIVPISRNFAQIPCGAS
jgi:hypothetical protein